MLLDLLDPKITPKVPKHIRKRALSILRHYPSSYHFTKIVDKMPEDFAVYNQFVRLSDEESS